MDNRVSTMASENDACTTLDSKSSFSTGNMTREQTFNTHLSCQEIELEQRTQYSRESHASIDVKPENNWIEGTSEKGKKDLFDEYRISIEGPIQSMDFDKEKKSVENVEQSIDKVDDTTQKSSSDIMDKLIREITVMSENDDLKNNDDHDVNVEKNNEDEEHEGNYDHTNVNSSQVNAVPAKKESKWKSRTIASHFNSDDDDINDLDDIITVVSPPPVGHINDFMPNDPANKKNNDEFFEDSSISLLDSERLITKLMRNIGPPTKYRPSSKENWKWSKQGIQFVDLITKVPLSKVWHRTTQILAMIVFIANVIVSFYDIVRDFQYLYYKVPALILCVLENIILLVVWLILKSPRFQKDGERSVKYQQYIENILHEVLMYPLLAIAAFGFSTEKMYEKPSDAFGWAQLILLVIDVVELIWTQVVRMMMTYKMFRNLEAMVQRQESSKKLGCCQWSSAGWILLRTYITTVGNVVTFLVFLTMLLLQVHYDNITTGDYRITWRSGILLLCFILLPLYSLIVYILANAFWAMEILVHVNVTAGSNSEFQEQVSKQYGAIVSDALNFSLTKVESNIAKLHELQNVHVLRKFIFVALEPLNSFLLVIWQSLFILSLVSLYPFDNDTVRLALQIVFGLLLLIANFHVFILAILADIVFVFVLIGIIFYPASLPLCCSKRYPVSPEDKDIKIKYMGH